MDKKEKIRLLRQGLVGGIPIGLGYFAVAFSLGIAAKNAGLTPFQSLVSSLLCNASAGQYAGYTLIGASASLVEIALMTFIANARYLLMSCSMSQRISPDAPLRHRFLFAFYLTDELFGINMARPGWLEPMYLLGAAMFASPCWALGAMLGTAAGNILPQAAVSALSVSLYGMFLAIIIPPAKSDRVVAVLIAVCFAASCACTYLPGIRELSEGTRTIVLTLVLSAGAAVLFPRKEES